MGLEITEFCEKLVNLVCPDKIDEWKTLDPDILQTVYNAIEWKFKEEITVKTLTIKLDASEIITQLDRIKESLNGEHDSVGSICEAIRNSMKQEVT